jgi:DNA-binding NtrC family response regulator
MMKRRILIVDDEPNIHAILSAFLSGSGYEVASAYTASETLDFIGNGHFDLVILDIGLEGDNGLELLRQIKTKRPQLPVIMYTGMGFDEELLQKALQNGAAGYASKTLPPDHLQIEIQRALQRRGSPPKS